MSRNQVWILLTLLLGVFMGALDIFIIAPALGAIQAGLQISPRLITWSFSAYTLVLVVTQPLTATLSDRLGRRWIYVACVLLFGCGSALCAQATAFPLFIVGRSVQAIGAGGVIPVASAVIADVFPEEKRGTALGIVGSVFGLAFILGPIIGAVLTQGIHLGGVITNWHAIFVVNLPLVAVIAVLGARLLPEQARTHHARAFDWSGALLLGASLFFLVFGLTQLNFNDFVANFRDEAAFPFILLGIFFLVPFWLHEARTPSPMVDTRILRRRQLIIAMLLSLCGGVVTTSIVYVPQLLENAFHLPAGAGGFYLVYVAVTLTLGTPIVGRLIDRIGSRAVIRGGTLLSVVAFTVLLLAGRNPVLLSLALMLIGFGLATFVGAPLRYIVINEVLPQRRAASISMLTVCSSMGQTIVLPLGGALISTALASAHTATSQADASVMAIHGFYTFVLLMLMSAVGLTVGLKTRQQELADRTQRQSPPPRQARFMRPATHAPHPQGEPAMTTQ